MIDILVSPVNSDNIAHDVRIWYNSSTGKLMMDDGNGPMAIGQVWGEEDVSVAEAVEVLARVLDE